jgi:hypothetical protein|nr:MAG TPA: hypothetical protein [Myoviridae sp. ctTS62]
MLNKLVKMSSLDDLQNAKHRHNGLWAIGSIFRATEEIMHLFKTNFMLANNAPKYAFIEELKCLIDLNDKFLELEVSDITPANALELYDYVDNLRANMIRSLTITVNGEDLVGFASSKNTTIELLPAIETLTNAYHELVEQSRHNLLASISINPSLDHSEFDQLRKLCSKLQCMQDHEIRANLTNNTFEFLRLAKQIDPAIKNSLAFQNQGL